MLTCSSEIIPKIDLYKMLNFLYINIKKTLTAHLTFSTCTHSMQMLTFNNNAPKIISKSIHNKQIKTL